MTTREVPFRATVNGDGELEIPAHVVEDLDLHDGDTVTAGIMLGAADVADAPGGGGE